MVKGVARHAVVVRSPGLKEFEQAIFIVSGDAEAPQVRSPAQLLDLACSLAAAHQVGTAAPVKARRPIWPLVLSFAAGAVSTAAAWWAVATFLLA